MPAFLGHPVSTFPDGTRTAADAAAATVFPLTPDELVTMTGGRVADVAAA